MNSLTSNVVVVRHGSTCQTLPGTEVHHRDFPDLREIGEDVIHACRRLEQSMDAALREASSIWRRDSLQQALEEVREFLRG